MDMFCNQCEQAARQQGCDTVGVCGKEPHIAALQDILLYQLKGIGYLAHQARKRGHVNQEVDRFITEALFSTVTNVDFDAERLVGWVQKAKTMRDTIAHAYKNIAAQAGEGIDESHWPASALYEPQETEQGLQKDARVIQEATAIAGTSNPDIRSLQELLTYGLKGMAAYADHAALLGSESPDVYAFFHMALTALNENDLSVDELVSLNMRCGTVNVTVMEMLDTAHTTRFGHPEPTEVSTALQEGPAIVVTGHDLLNLENLLKQSEGTGVNIYTHGEMLPAHAYPELKKYKHLVGHYGTAWQNQQKEFDQIPAAVLFNTNCIQKPRENYQDRVFTCQLVAWPGVAHVQDNDFGPVIAKAQELGGFKAQAGKTLMTGFGHNTVLGVADKVVEAVKSGAINHFFLVGGCDGAKPGRNYYTEFVEKTPKDSLILTLACGKFRFNDLDLGEIGGLPRLLDIGQCNDAFSAVKIAQALAEAFDCGINDLPLSLVLSWYEQKAVVILLSLLALGIKGIRIGPSLPAFISPNILNFLVENFELKAIGTADEDLAAILN
jgi:hydroxylamine reductase